MLKNLRNASIATIAVMLLGGGCLTMGMLYLKETEHTQLLERQLAEYEKKVKRAEIEQSVNKQMEEIADGQNLIARDKAKMAEENAEEAQRQAEIAQENANEAKKQAEIAQENAEEAKRQTKIANDNAENASRQEAIARREKSKADTLRYIALGRSLGSQSLQMRSNDVETADLLAYASYYFTNEYKQDEATLYNSAVFNALTEGSHTKQKWVRHKGMVTAISFDRERKDWRFFTTSSYGEIKCHTFDPVQNKLTRTEDVFANSNYDFRDAIYSQGTIYALSFTGHLVVKKDEWSAPRIVELAGMERPTAFCEMDGDNMFIIGAKSIGVFSKSTLTLTGTRSFECNIVCLGKDLASRPLFFDDCGNMHSVRSLDEIDTKPVPKGINGQVTAYANSKGRKLEAYGTKNGIVYVVNNNDITAITSHESKVTKLRLVTEKIYSSSYDGKLNLVIYNKGKNEKMEPLTLLNTQEWMLCFDLDANKDRVWTCGQNGSITKSLIRIDLMVDKMRTEVLNRNFTHAEWNYYIGRNEPYQAFIGKEGGK